MKTASSKRPGQPLGGNDRLTKPRGPGDVAEASSASCQPASTAVQAPPRPKVKSIALYNYKGGVGKTTMTRELAATLAKMRLRVGLIDVDAQCNLTTFFGEGDEEYASVRHSGQDVAGQQEKAVEEAKEEDIQHAAAGQPVMQYGLQDEGGAPALLDKLYSVRQDSTLRNIYDVIEPVANGLTETYNNTELPLKLIPGPQSCSEIWLLPGCVRIVEYERMFEVAPDIKLRYLLGIFRSLINKMAREKNLDYILLDCSPSSGIINKIAVMSCDYILPPAMPDLGNVSSLHGMLTHVLPSWLEFRRTTLMPLIGPGKLHEDFTLPTSDPRLLPVMVINFSWRGKFNIINSAKERAVISKPSQWIRTLRALMTLDDRVPGVPEDIRKKMLEVMYPEKVTNDGTEEKFMVWALVQKLESALSASSELRWPMVWMSDPADYKGKEHEIRQRQERSNSTQSRWRHDARVLLQRLTSVCHFLQTLPASGVAARMAM